MPGHVYPEAHAAGSASMVLGDIGQHAAIMITGSVGKLKIINPSREQLQTSQDTFRGVQLQLNDLSGRVARLEMAEARMASSVTTSAAPQSSPSNLNEKTNHEEIYVKAQAAQASQIAMSFSSQSSDRKGLRERSQFEVKRQHFLAQEMSAKLSRRDMTIPPETKKESEAESPTSKLMNIPESKPVHRKFRRSLAKPLSLEWESESSLAQDWAKNPWALPAKRPEISPVVSSEWFDAAESQPSQHVSADLEVKTRDSSDQYTVVPANSAVQVSSPLPPPALPQPQFQYNDADAQAAIATLLDRLKQTSATATIQTTTVETKKEITTTAQAATKVAATRIADARRTARSRGRRSSGPRRSIGTQRSTPQPETQPETQPIAASKVETVSSTTTTSTATVAALNIESLSASTSNHDCLATRATMSSLAVEEWSKAPSTSAYTNELQLTYTLLEVRGKRELDITCSGDALLHGISVGTERHMRFDAVEKTYSLNTAVGESGSFEVRVFLTKGWKWAASDQRCSISGTEHIKHSCFETIYFPSTVPWEKVVVKHIVRCYEYCCTSSTKDLAKDVATVAGAGALLGAFALYEGFSAYRRRKSPVPMVPK